MPLLPTEEHELDRVTGKLVVARGNPTRGYLTMENGGATQYYYQGGQFFAGPNECEPEEVPQAFRDEIEAHPLISDTERGVSVTETCKYCKVKMNSSLMAAHVIDHMDDMMKHLGSQEEQTRKAKG